MGSVKDLIILEEARKDKIGKARFVFSDRYSVFDWGEMPDHIKNKGYAIALLGAYFFEKMEEMGIENHYVGLIEKEKVKKLDELKKPSNVMEIKLLRVIKPDIKEGKYDYSIYKKEKGNFLIPLEVIYRNYLPEGSSVFRRLKEGQLKLEDLGLEHYPKPGEKLKETFIDVSTKLEITDRYISWEEAKEIAGLSKEEMEEMKKIVEKINNLVTEEFAKIGLRNEDGKIEFGFDDKRNLMVVDVVGTLDECRFTWNGIPISKEIARIYYRKTEWYKAVEEAKKKDRQKWKEICKLKPEPLPEKLSKAISQIYCACTNEITGRIWFEEVPPLKEILEDIKEVMR